MSVNESKLLSDIYDDVDDTDIFEFQQNNDGKDDAKSIESNKDDNSFKREELRLKNEQLLKNNELLERRISEIYLTAKAEMERKNKRIEELNEEINKLVIKFSHANKFKKDFTKPQHLVTKEETVPVNANVENNNSTKVFSTNLQKAKPLEIIVLEDDDDSIEGIVKNLPNNHSKVDDKVIEIKKSSEINPVKPVKHNKVPAKNEEKKKLINLVHNEIGDNKSTSMLINEIVDKAKCMLYSKKEKTKKLSTENDENNKAEENKSSINNSNPPESINIISNKPINLKESCSRNKKIEKPIFNATAYKIPKKSTDYATTTTTTDSNEKVSALFRKTDFVAHQHRKKTSPPASRRRRCLHRFPRTPSRSPSRRRRNEDYPYKDSNKIVRSKIVTPRAKRTYYSPPKDRHGNVIPPYNQWKKLQMERNKLTKLKDYQYRKRSCKRNLEAFQEEINFDEFKDLRPEVMQMSVEDLERELELKVKELNDFELLSDFSDLSEPDCWLTEGEDDNAEPETDKKINPYEKIIDEIKEIENPYSMDVVEHGEPQNKTLMVSEQCKESKIKNIEDTEKIKKKINLQDYKKRSEEANTENLTEEVMMVNSQQQQLKNGPELEILLDRLDVSRNREICNLSSKKREEFNSDNIQIQNTNSFMHDLSVSDDELDLRKNENIKILQVQVFTPKKASSNNTTKLEDVECIEDIQKAIKNSDLLLKPTNKSTSHINSVELEKCLEGDSPQKPSQPKLQEEGLKTPLKFQLIRLFGSDSPLTPESSSTKKKVLEETEEDQYSEKLPIFCNNPNYISNPPDATDRLKLAEILDSPTNQLKNKTDKIKNVQKCRTTTTKCCIKVKMDFGNKTKLNNKYQKKKRKKVLDSDSEIESSNRKAKKLRKIEETNKKIQPLVKKLPHTPHKKKEVKVFEDKVTNLLLQEQKIMKIGKSPRRITPIKIGEITRNPNNLMLNTNVENSSPLPRMEKMLKHFEEKTEELKIKSSTIEDFAEILKENASTPKKIIEPSPKETNISSTLSVELKPYMIVPLKRHPRRRVKVMVL